MSAEQEDPKRVALQTSLQRPTILSKTMKAIGMVNPIFKKKRTSGVGTVDSVSRFDIHVGGNGCQDENHPDVDTEPETEDQERCHFQGADEEFTVRRESSHPTDLAQDIQIEAQQRQSQRHGLKGTPDEKAANAMNRGRVACSRRSSPSSESRPIAIMLNDGPEKNSNSEDADGAMPSMIPINSPPRPSSRSSKARASSWKEQHEVSKARRSGQQDPPATLMTHLMESSTGHAATDHSKGEKEGKRSSRSVEETDEVIVQKWILLVLFLELLTETLKHHSTSIEKGRLDQKASTRGFQHLFVPMGNRVPRRRWRRAKVATVTSQRFRQ